MTLSQVELQSVNGAPVMAHGTTGACSFLSLSKRFPLCSLIYEACLRNSTICTFIHQPRLCCDWSTFGLWPSSFRRWLHCSNCRFFLLSTVMSKSFKPELYGKVVVSVERLKVACAEMWRVEVVALDCECGVVQRGLLTGFFLLHRKEETVNVFC